MPACDGQLEVLYVELGGSRGVKMNRGNTNSILNEKAANYFEAWRVALSDSEHLDRSTREREKKVGGE